MSPTPKLAIKWALTHVTPSFARRIVAENEIVLTLEFSTKSSPCRAGRRCYLVRSEIISKE